jgi:mRNA interferase MazF
MKNGTSIEQRDVVLVPFPFSDLTSSKKRPALVVSIGKFNRSGDDVICCLITSNLKDRGNAVFISNKDMESGFLEFDSKVKPYRLFTANKNIIYRVLGKLGKEKSRIISSRIKSLVDVE